MFPMSFFEDSSQPETLPLAARARAFCSFMSPANPSSSTLSPLSSQISFVRSGGKPKVS